MKYILYGAGPYMREHIDNEKMRYFDYIVDQDINKNGIAYLGKEIKFPRALLQEDRDNIFIVITAFGQLYSIEYDLRQMGFEKEKHFEWFGRLYNLYPKHSFWLNLRSENWIKDEAAWRAYSPVGVAHERAELVAKMLDWTNVQSVLDLGAGSEPMRQLLPSEQGIKYYPVDYKQLTENTLIYDFNQKQFPDIKADVVILIGVHGYVDYEAWLIDEAANAVNIGGQFIASFNYSTGNFHAFDFITKYRDKMKCVDYAYRDNVYGIFRFRRFL